MLYAALKRATAIDEVNHRGSNQISCLCLTTHAECLRKH